MTISEFTLNVDETTASVRQILPLSDYSTDETVTTSIEQFVETPYTSDIAEIKLMLIVIIVFIGAILGSQLIRNLRK